MLSTQAWNAFLKTLEEPPPNTIFVLATTEANKVLPTVVDRCHRFDFSRPTVEQLAARRAPRRRAGEHRRSRPDAVALLARHATGSFRDALGTLEQLVTYSRHDDRARGRARRARRRRRRPAVRRARRGRRPATRARALLAAARLAESGRDAGAVPARPRGPRARAAGRADARRGARPSWRVTPERDARLAEQAARVRARRRRRGCSTCSPPRCEAVKDGADARTQLELALVKAATPGGRRRRRARCSRGSSGSRRALRRRRRRRAPRRRARARAAAAGTRPPPAPAAAAQPPRSRRPPPPAASRAARRRRRAPSAGRRDRPAAAAAPGARPRRPARELWPAVARRVRDGRTALLRPRCLADAPAGRSSTARDARRSRFAPDGRGLLARARPTPPANAPGRSPRRVRTVTGRRRLQLALRARAT